MNYPSIWGADALFSYGGSGAISGRLCPHRLGIRFETPMGCTMLFHAGDIIKTEYECVMTDRICLKVITPEAESSLEVLAVSPCGVLVLADGSIDVSVCFDGKSDITELGDERTYVCGEDEASLVMKDGQKRLIALALGKNSLERAQSILGMDIDLCRERVIRKHASLTIPDGISAQHEQVYRRCASIVHSSICTDGESRIFAKRDAHGLYIDSRQAMLAAVGLKNIFPKVSLSTVTYLADFVDESGILPAVIKGGFGDSSCAAPLLPWAFCQVCGEEEALVERFYGALRKHVLYFINERDMNKNNLYHWLAGAKNNPGIDSGMLNSPRFADNVIVDAPDLCVYLYMSVKAMAKMSELIKENNDVLYWGVIAERIRLGINDLLYNDDDKLFFDRSVIGKKLSKTKTIAGLMPIFGGMCNPSRLACLTEHLFDKHSFGAKYGVASVSKSEKSFESDMYAGSVCFEENYKIVYGLLMSGEREKAARIAARCLEAASRGYQTNGVVFEYYHPDSLSYTPCQKRCGLGGGSMGIYGYNTCRRDCAASAAFVLAMIDLLSSNEQK